MAPAGSKIKKGCERRREDRGTLWLIRAVLSTVLLVPIPDRVYLFSQPEDAVHCLPATRRAQSADAHLPTVPTTQSSGTTQVSMASALSIADVQLDARLFKHVARLAWRWLLVAPHSARE
jgi:hypothetical protein